MGLRWYAVRTEPRTEFLAANELGQDGFEIFFPKAIIPHRQAGRSETPLFPGYLFLRCDPENDGWPAFRPSHRVLGWLSFEGETPWLPDQVIWELIERSERINLEGGLWRRFQPGDQVSVASFGMANVARVVEEAKSPEARVKILVEFMGRIVSAQVPWDKLQPVEDRASGQSTMAKGPSRRTRGKRRWIRGFSPQALARV